MISKASASKKAVYLFVVICFSRLYQVIKLFLYSPSSGLYSCPLAMTDGAARVIKVIRGMLLLLNIVMNVNKCNIYLKHAK